MQKPSSSSSKHSRASSSGSKSANSYSITRGLDIANQIVLGIITDGGPRNTKHEAVNSRAKDPAAQTAAKSAKQQQGPIDSAGPIPSLSQHAESHANWKSTAYNAAKLTLDLVKEGSGAFPPLQTVTGLLSSIIAQYDVRTKNSVFNDSNQDCFNSRSQSVTASPFPDCFLELKACNTLLHNLLWMVIIVKPSDVVF